MNSPRRQGRVAAVREGRRDPVHFLEALPRLRIDLRVHFLLCLRAAAGRVTIVALTAALDPSLPVKR